MTPDHGGSLSFRRIYARVCDPEALVPDGEVVDVVRTAMLEFANAPRSLGDLVDEAAAWSAAEAARFEAMDGTDDDGRRRTDRRAALGCAPLGLALGAWLQWLISPGTAEESLRLRILSLYASDVGVGHAGAARGDAYLDLLRTLRISENAVPLARLAADVRIADAAFRLPAVLLLMSRRPDDFSAELVGADLCLRAVELLPPLGRVRSNVQADWAAIDYGSTRGGDRPAIEQCRAVAEALVLGGRESAARITAGFSWTLAALRNSVDTLYDELNASLDPAHEMVELLRRRSVEGSFYHQHVVLEDRPLTEWLRDCRDNPGQFLTVLARSRFVRPGHADSSPLVRELVSERGPMFRVFPAEDIAVITRWIDALPDAASVGIEPVSRRIPSDERLAALADLLEDSGPRGRHPSDLRDAYHLLLGRNVSPALRDWSVRYVNGWLARTRYGMHARSTPLPPAWPAGGLRSWLHAQHALSSAEFEESAQTPLPSRAEVVDDAVQKAPLTLIDGSWLQGFTDYELASSPIGQFLFATFWDELGNGELNLNHPLIYREVLKEMAVDLPPTAAADFARWPGFRDASFELPVYWLCIGRFPRTFRPEILGLNLAMELSGVGGTYRRASMALRSHGFSSRFVDIHNTIDNVATGHAAWAAEAVDTLLSELPDSHGPGGRPMVWERVRTGYRSLNPPSGFMARRAARRGRLAHV
jgi:hypothetical protein